MQILNSKLKTLIPKLLFLGIVLLSTFVVRPSTVFGYYTNMPASVVVGQTDFTSSSGGLSASNFSSSNSPYGVAAEGNNLIVSDRSNSRILIYNKIPSSNGASADVVLGQPNFTTGVANYGGLSASSIFTPLSVELKNNKLFVFDKDNSRVLIYNSLPTTNNKAADVVVMKTSFTDATNTTTQTTGSLGFGAVATDGQRLFIASGADHRVLIWNSIPTSNGAPADVVLGQQSFTTKAANDSNGDGVTDTVAANTLNGPSGVYSDGTRLFVADSSNHRVLIWTSMPSRNGQPADLVLGQQSFTIKAGNDSDGDGVTDTVAANTLNDPDSVYSDGRRLFITDVLNDRVLIYNNIPSSNGARADIALGQPDLTSGSFPSSAQANNFLTLTRIVASNNKLFVNDKAGHRILIFNNQLPDVSLSRTITGQPNGLLRFSGTASTNVTNEIVKQIEYSVNGGTWTGGFPTDGKFDSATENYYFDFDPHINTMASPPSPEASASQGSGYTVKIRSTHNNDIDTSKATLYFEPFLANSPVNNTFTLNRLPSFTFSVQKLRFSDLKDNLDHFRVMIRPADARGFGEASWQPYVDFIPVDYDSVRLSGDNLRPNQVTTMNGTYEDKFKTVTYAEDNSVFTVQPKSVDSMGNSSDKYLENGGKLLSNATYQWKIQAEDHAGQIQETDPRTLRIGTRQVVTSRPYFPLSIYAISGVPGYFDISTSHPDTAPKTLTLTAQHPKFAPTFAGIAMAGSTVTIAVTDDMLAASSACLTSASAPPCTTTYQTTVKPDSTFRITVPKAFKIGNSYDVTVSVKDTGDNYNELPTFTIGVAAH